jgi:hypothetical protein
VRRERTERRAHTLSTVRVTVAMMIDNNYYELKFGLSVSAIRSRYQTALRCFPPTREVLSGQGVRGVVSLSGVYTGAERK